MRCPDELLHIVDGVCHRFFHGLLAGEASRDGGRESATSTVDASPGKVGAGMAEVMGLAIVPEQIEAICIAVKVSALEKARDLILAGYVACRLFHVRFRCDASFEHPLSFGNVRGHQGGAWQEPGADGSSGVFLQ